MSGLQSRLRRFDSDPRLQSKTLLLPTMRSCKLRGEVTRILFLHGCPCEKREGCVRESRAGGERATRRRAREYPEAAGVLSFVPVGQEVLGSRA